MTLCDFLYITVCINITGLHDALDTMANGVYLKYDALPCQCCKNNTPLYKQPIDYGYLWATHTGWLASTTDLCSEVLFRSRSLTSESPELEPKGSWKEQDYADFTQFANNPDIVVASCGMCSICPLH